MGVAEGDECGVLKERVRILEEQCQVAVCLSPGKQSRTIRWSTRRLDTAWFLPNLDLAEAGLSAILGTEGAADADGRATGTGQHPISLEFAKLMGINAGDEPLFGKRQ